MTAHIKIPRAHRLRPVLGVVAMLLVSVVVSGKSTLASRCPEHNAVQNAAQKAAAATAARASVAHAAAQARAAWHEVEREAESVSTGLDLEVRIWNVRIGFPWLKSLPLTPGRRVVLSLWETDPDRY